MPPTATPPVAPTALVMTPASVTPWTLMLPLSRDIFLDFDGSFDVDDFVLDFEAIGHCERWPLPYLASWLFPHLKLAVHAWYLNHNLHLGTLAWPDLRVAVLAFFRNPDHADNADSCFYFHHQAPTEPIHAYFSILQKLAGRYEPAMPPPVFAPL